ncbi:hypothetical protein K438DRAFT_1766519 [Mycena galopus ATCC 62051]|nr:hypothetical protein K438DRAFT_1766519 [Mycena galopus ATCC 62051]
MLMKSTTLAPRARWRSAALLRHQLLSSPVLRRRDPPSQVSIQPLSGDVPEATRRSPSPPNTFNASSSSPRPITSGASSPSPTSNRTSGVIPAQSSNNAHKERNSGFQSHSPSQENTSTGSSSSPGPSTSSASSPSPTTELTSGTIAGAIAVSVGTALYLYYNSRRTRRPGDM